MACRSRIQSNQWFSWVTATFAKWQINNNLESTQFINLQVHFTSLKTISILSIVYNWIFCKSFQEHLLIGTDSRKCRILQWYMMRALASLISSWHPLSLHALRGETFHRMKTKRLGLFCASMTTYFRKTPLFEGSFVWLLAAYRSVAHSQRYATFWSFWAYVKV